MSIHEYKEMYDRQKGLCEICQNPMDANNKSSIDKSCYVDYNHKTNKVRALLCRPCNAAIGLLKENPTIIQRALEYINKHNEVIFATT